MLLFHRLAALGLRRLGAVYLLVFFGAVAMAPHQHMNSIEDLISDGPSDSGTILERRGCQDPADPQWSGVHWLDDNPCLACFHHDFDSAIEAIAVLVLAPESGALPLTPAPDRFAFPSIPPRSSDSRAPPAIA